MIASVMLLVMGQVAEPRPDMASFIAQVRAYTTFVTPHCAPEVVEPYRHFNARRDAAFVRSLKETPLEQTYRKAVQEQRAQDRATVYECFGPPPPPPPPGSPPPPPQNPRSYTIDSAQKRLRGAAQDIPGFFDQGDALFARMVASRDQMEGKGTR